TSVQFHGILVKTLLGDMYLQSQHSGGKDRWILGALAGQPGLLKCQAPGSVRDLDSKSMIKKKKLTVVAAIGLIHANHPAATGSSLLRRYVTGISMVSGFP
ncbi:hypothetical protein ACQP3L_32125, partial [Escherichia coli]